MKIAGYLSTSLIEWPGKIAAVVFTPGCNFRCPFCHNAHLVIPKEIKKINLIAEEKILADLEKRKNWLDLIVVSGGEPTIGPDLAGFLKKVKKIGLQTMVETNGSLPKMVGRLVNKNLVDLWAMDLKTCWEGYPQTTGFKKTDLIKKSLAVLLKSNKPLNLRTTIVPVIHNQEKLLTMAEQIGKMILEFRPLAKKFSWQWQDFQPKNTLNPEFEKTEPYSEKEIITLLSRVRENAGFKIEYEK